MCNRPAADLTRSVKAWARREERPPEDRAVTTPEQASVPKALLTGRTQCSLEVTQENAAGTAPHYLPEITEASHQVGPPQLELTGCRMAAKNLG